MIDYIDDNSQEAVDADRAAYPKDTNFGKVRLEFLPPNPSRLIIPPMPSGALNLRNKL